MLRNKSRLPFLILMATTTILAFASTIFAEQQPVVKPTYAKLCTYCHKAEANTLMGFFDSIAFKAETIQMKVDDAVQLVRFDVDDVKVVTAAGKEMDGEALHKTKKGQPIQIIFTEKNGLKTAVKVVEKPPAKVAPEMLITTAQVEKLVGLGPDKGKYFLYDARPLFRFQEGAIPTAVSMPYDLFDKMTELLPQDKNAQIIFYCAGINCYMSSGSAEKAKKLGYTNVRVYRDGIPAWSAKNYTVLSAEALKAAWIDKDVPYLLLDLRSGKVASRGFIKGAVSFPAAQVAKLIKKLPSAENNPPIVVYDAKGSKSEVQVAKALLKSGYGNVKILLGGFDGWKSAKFEAMTGKLASKASYVPKPNPGEIDIQVFKGYATALPSNVFILDVRNPNEVKTGILKTAVNIPMEDLQDRMAEIPKDKLIITQCSTGVRAEMAYYTLKDLGFSNVKFLKANTKFEKDGTYSITKD